MVLTEISFAQTTKERVGISPWGKEDEIGTLNLMSDKSRLWVLTKISSGKVYDLSTEYFVGLPSFHSLGDPTCQYWLTHTPHGTVIDNPNSLGQEMNHKVSYTGDSISLYTHMGTHINALNHFGLNGKIGNAFTSEKNLGDKGWNKTGAETIPPVIARGILIDVAAYKGVKNLSNSYRVTASDLKGALQKQQVTLQKGDVVLISTGPMVHYANARKFLHNYAGISLDAVKWLVEQQGIMLLGADNLSFEAFPPERSDNWVSVHTYLLAEKGVMFIEQIYLENLAQDKAYTLAFIGASMKLRSASDAPMQP
jgi:kynurenine formamidase